MARKAKKQIEAEINMTPMIDVVFQLIIFFIVTVNLDQESILEQIELPDAPHSIEIIRKDPRQVTIQVDSRGRYYIGSGAPYSLRELNIVLRNTVKRGGLHIPILIRGDERTTHKYIRRAMDVCAREGLYRIKFAAMKQSATEYRGGR